jgi:serine/threonine-protein kinase
LTHRDGRPDFVKIVDFGIAKVQPSEGTSGGPKLTRAGSVFGTPEYMAPEQASGRGETDHRIDIYALGVILYEMLVGKVPVKGTSPMQTIAKQIMDPIASPRTAYPQLAIPVALEVIVMRALAKNRDERYPTMGELLAALDNVVGRLVAGGTPSLPPDEPAPAEAERAESAMPTKHREPAPRGPRPARWPYALLALAVITSATAAVVVVVHVRRDGNDKRAGTDPRDAGRARDAAVMAFTADQVSPPADAAAAIAPPADAAVGARGPQEPTKPAIAHHPTTITIEVMTRPGDAEVYIDGHHRGPSGVGIEEPWGKKLTVECKAPHLYGRKSVVFDGSTPSVYCVATRIPMCVEGLNNPYDVCEEPGTDAR